MPLASKCTSIMESREFRILLVCGLNKVTLAVLKLIKPEPFLQQLKTG